MRSDGVLKLVGAAIAAVAIVFAPGSSAAPGARSSVERTIPLLRVGLTGTISTLDPAVSNSGLEQMMANLGLEGLMKYRSSGALQPNLAKAVSNPNPLTYVYTLRRGIKFWNGHELTARDAAYSLNYYRDPKHGTSGEPGFGDIRSVEARGRYKVVITLKARNVAWQSVLARSGWIFEKKFADAHPGTMGEPGVLMMGTGPWKFVRLDPTRGLELSANSRYWGGKVPIKRISVKFIPDLTNMALAFRAGEIDVVPNLTDPAAFKNASGANIIAVPGCDLVYLPMNTKRPPWNDVHVRRAVAYAVDRKGLVAAWGGGLAGVPLSTLILPVQLRTLGSKTAVAKALKSVRQYRLNVTNGRREIAQSNYPNGVSTEIVIPNFTVFTKVGEALIAMLDRVGIDARPKIVGLAEFIAALTGPRDNIGALLTGNPCSIDPSYNPSQNLASEQARDGGGNTANYTNAAVDSLIAKGQTTSNRAKRLAIYKKLLTIVGRDMPYVPLISATRTVAISRKYKWPGYSLVTLEGQWALSIKPR
jgi:peptide/nickel transport system substrate-binding protein